MNRYVKKRLFNAKAGAKGGRREDLDRRYFRSAWEANVSRWLNEIKRRGDIIDWKYEDVEFAFSGIKRGVRFYRPDFHIFEEGRDYFIEVKGVLDPKSVTALARMMRQYPDVTVLLMDKKRYAELCSEFGHLEHWEG